MKIEIEKLFDQFSSNTFIRVNDELLSYSSVFEKTKSQKVEAISTIAYTPTLACVISIISGLIQSKLTIIYNPKNPTHLSALQNLSHSTISNRLNSKYTGLFTSGSTGKPKLVLHSLDNHYYSAEGSHENIRYETGDSWVLSLPAHHISGLSIILRTIFSGASIVFNQGSRLLDKFENLNFTHISLVPYQLRKIIQNPRKLSKLKQARAILLGGATTSKDLIGDALAKGLKLHTTYGSTEMASQICTTKELTLDELNTSGRLLKHREIKFLNKQILVRGKTMAEGYLGNSELTTITDEDGWYNTGDLGYFDEKNRIQILGRADNMFISGGENVYPEEIESAILKNMANVEKCLVIPLDSADFGARPVALIAPLANLKQPNLKDVIAAISHELLIYKLPTAVFAYPEIDSGLKPNRKHHIEYVKKHYFN